MNISSRCEYACRALLELSLRENAEDPITAVEIAERRHVPEKYLVHILLQLKRAGLVRSVRGAQGGYQLVKAPDDVTLLDIIQAIDGPILDPLPVDDVAGKQMNGTWRKVARGIEQVMRGITIRQILEQSDESPMYYI